MIDIEISEIEIRKMTAIRSGVMDISKRYADAKCSLLNFAMPTMLLRPDGTVESIYSKEITEALEQYDAACKEEIDRYLNSQGMGAPKGEKS